MPMPDERGDRPDASAPSAAPAPPAPPLHRSAARFPRATRPPRRTAQDAYGVRSPPRRRAPVDRADPADREDRVDPTARPDVRERATGSARCSGCSSPSCCWRRSGWSGCPRTPGARSPGSTTPRAASAPPSSRARRSCWSGPTRARACPRPSRRSSAPAPSAASGPTRSCSSITPATGKPVLISLPRDSYVPVPGHGSNKINAAYAIGGPDLLVQTVEQSPACGSTATRGGLRRVRGGHRRPGRDPHVHPRGDQGHRLPPRPEEGLPDPRRHHGARLRPDAQGRPARRPRPGRAAARRCWPRWPRSQPRRPPC